MRERVCACVRACVYVWQLPVNEVVLVIVL